MLSVISYSIKRYIHSVVCVTSVRSVVRSKASSPQRSVCCLVVQFSEYSFFFKLMGLKPTSSSSSTSLCLSFCKVFYKSLLIENMFTVFSFSSFDCSKYITSLCTLCYISLYLMLTDQMVFSFILQHPISKPCKCFDLLPQVTKLQHHTTICSESITAVVSSLNIMSFRMLKERPFNGMLLMLWRS